MSTSSLATSNDSTVFETLIILKLMLSKILLNCSVNRKNPL